MNFHLHYLCTTMDQLFFYENGWHLNIRFYKYTMRHFPLCIRITWLSSPICSGQQQQQQTYQLQLTLSLYYLWIDSESCDWKLTHTTNKSNAMHRYVCGRIRLGCVLRIINNFGIWTFHWAGRMYITFYQSVMGNRSLVMFWRSRNATVLLLSSVEMIYVRICNIYVCSFEHAHPCRRPLIFFFISSVLLSF